MFHICGKSFDFNPDQGDENYKAIPTNNNYPYLIKWLRYSRKQVVDRMEYKFLFSSTEVWQLYEHYI